jgi:hypothetical protein
MGGGISLAFPLTPETTLTLINEHLVVQRQCDRNRGGFRLSQDDSHQLADTALGQHWHRHC